MKAKFVSLGVAALLETVGVLSSIADTTVSTVDELVKAIKAKQTPIQLNPGTYDVSALKAQRADEWGWVATDADKRTAHLVIGAKLVLKGNTSAHWSEWTDENKVVIKGKGSARLIYGYGGSGRDVQYSGIIFENGSSVNDAGHTGGGAIYAMNCNKGFATNCVFRNCSAGGDAYGSVGGGATFCVTLKDCLFENCTAVGYGGGAYLDGSSNYGSPTNSAIGCVFRNCSAGAQGGAVFAKNLQAYGTPNAGVIDGCTFLTNVAGTCGGAVCADQAGLVVGCRFEGNRAPKGGALMANNINSCVVSNCTFVGNEATSGSGGAINVWKDVRASAFSDNVAQGSGGAIHDCDGVAGCGFTNNVAKCLIDKKNDAGGALSDVPLAADCLFVGNVSALSCGAAGYGTYTNCWFEGNCATNSGGAVCGGTSIDCTFTNNWVVKSGASGGAVFSGTLRNCLVTGNQALADRGGGVYRSTCYGCTFRNNYVTSSTRGGAAAFSTCYGCTFTGIGDVSCGTYVDCDFNGVQSVANDSIKFYVAESLEWGGADCFLTNCLFRNCHVSHLIKSNGKTLRAVNCTFADNVLTDYNANIKAAVAFADLGISAYSPQKVYSAGRVEIVNCLFAGNAIGGEPSDFTLYANPTAADDGGSCEIVADHCLYEKPGTSTGRTSVSNVFQGSPRFVAGDARWPDEPYYALRHSSAARNRGVNQDWMASGKDRSGRARIVDAVVDIGCYECYVPPIGSLLLFR